MSIIKNFHNQLKVGKYPVVLKDIRKHGLADIENFPENLAIEWKILAGVILNSAIELYKNDYVHLELEGTVWQEAIADQLVSLPETWKVHHK